MRGIEKISSKIPRKKMHSGVSCTICTSINEQNNPETFRQHIIMKHPSEYLPSLNELFEAEEKYDKEDVIIVWNGME